MSEATSACSPNVQKHREERPLGLRVRSAGLLTTVQDRGRPGWQRVGFPAAGAMDPLAAAIANRLVGNVGDEAVLEMTILGPELEFECKSLAAVTGADLGCELEVGGKRIPMPLWQTVHIESGARLRFLGRRSGVRAYLAVRGGIDVPILGGSRSTGLAGGLPGMYGRPLVDGDHLPIGAVDSSAPGEGESDIDASTIMVLPRGQRPSYPGQVTARVVLGPDLEVFAPEAIRQFFASEYRIGADSNRMGIRLEGPRVPPFRPATGLSEPQPLGTIQVTGGGHAILLMQDRQTVGGYPKLGIVCRPDLARLAQLMPGERVRFAPTSLEEAQRSTRQWLTFQQEPPLQTIHPAKNKSEHDGKRPR